MSRQRKGPVDPGLPSNLYAGNGSEPLLRVPEILERLAVSSSCLETMLRREVFPALSQLSPRVRVLPERSFDAWAASRVLERSRMPTVRHPARLPKWSRSLAPREYPRGMRFLRRREVVRRVRFGKSTLYRLIDRDLFPKPVPVAPRARRWLEQEVEDWLAELLDQAA